jgi:hypothetical protein
MWQTEKATHLFGDILEMYQATGFADDVERIAMLTGGGVGPFPGGPLAEVDAVQPYKQGAARRVARVSDEPVVAFAAAIGER